MIGQVVERKTPGLVLNQPLRGVAMDVQVAEIAEHLCDALSGLIGGRSDPPSPRTTPSVAMPSLDGWYDLDKYRQLGWGKPTSTLIYCRLGFDYILASQK